MTGGRSWCGSPSAVSRSWTRCWSRTSRTRRACWRRWTPGERDHLAAALRTLLASVGDTTLG
ncbi:hypothetical protein ACFYOK_13970 [Microbispora bryophytorum]|uniref:hypothetical protein n=1 Tax=Microbispora bryophytorum TaxID=1460882 RepID=UPI0033F292CD